ncbi:MAG: UDP-N-acetylglucosamine 2-epimerase (non-hydrolyzing) [Verrucomicrobia bacterium]|nr:UDP-N-acetylglucosamine 2-epimerase (non-hydrolyzing) [Verrucomicrobiota bacterium]
MRVLAVFGTRPEAIKMSPLILQMKSLPTRFKPIVCATGQQKQMLRQVLDTFGIRPDYDLAVMRPNQTLTGMTARILKGVDSVMSKENPDLVMVQGDTTSAFVAALVAFYHQVVVAHIEAGLRTGNLEHPFPEELNRTLIDRFARFCFAPTELNRRTLLREGVPSEQIFVTGNTGIDALLLIRERMKERAAVSPRDWGEATEAIKDRTRPIILITAHRRESFGARLEAIFGAIRNLAGRHKNWSFVYPVHLNPNVCKPAVELLSGLGNVHLIEPLAYESFVFLLDRASLILTDSGGIQEEAPSLGKPVIVMRETTERQEALNAGTVMLAGNSGRGLEELVERMMVMRRKHVRRNNPYGDGYAAQRILDVIWQRMGRY